MSGLTDNPIVVWSKRGSTTHITPVPKIADAFWHIDWEVLKESSTIAVEITATHQVLVLQGSVEDLNPMIQRLREPVLTEIDRTYQSVPEEIIDCLKRRGL